MGKHSTGRECPPEGHTGTTAGTTAGIHDTTDIKSLKNWLNTSTNSITSFTLLTRLSLFQSDIYRSAYWKLTEVYMLMNDCSVFALVGLLTPDTCWVAFFSDIACVFRKKSCITKADQHGYYNGQITALKWFTQLPFVYFCLLEFKLTIFGELSNKVNEFDKHQVICVVQNFVKDTMLTHTYTNLKQ